MSAKDRFYKFAKNSLWLLCPAELPFTVDTAGVCSEPRLLKFRTAANVGSRCVGSSHDLFHVTHVGATASPQNLNMREPSSEL